MKADVIVENHGSVCMVTPMSPEAREWVNENVSLESWQWIGASFACEPRYVANLVEGMQDDGLTIDV